MTDATLLYKIAKAYYEDGQTQDQIGKRFGLSRIKVSRLLNQARQTRVVQITITPPAGSFADLERMLEQAYGLDEVVVVEAAADAATTVERVGVATADYLYRVLGEQRIVDISWGTTLAMMVDALTPQNLPDLRVVQMLGGLGHVESETYGGELTRRMAQTLGAKMRQLPAPGIVASQLVRDALLLDANIAETLALAARADLAVVGIGVPSRGALVRQAGIFTDAELAELEQLGAVGDIALRFFDAHGRPVEHPINERIIGLELEQIRRIPRVVGVAGGPDKLEVVRGALRGKLVHVLITDAATAAQLMKESPPAMNISNTQGTARATAAA